MRIRTILAAAAAPAALAAVVLGTAGQASAATVPGAVHAVTHSAQHSDTTNGGVVWATDNMSEQLTVVPVTPTVQNGEANYQVTIDVTGSFKGTLDPGRDGTNDPAQGYLKPLASSGPVKGTISYYVQSATPPDPASLLPNQAPDTGLGDAISQLFDNQPKSSLIVGGGDVYTFSYQNGNYVQNGAPTNAITGDVTGH